MLALIVTAPVWSAPAPSTLIVPGQSIGSLRIGMTRAALLAGWGHPEKVETAYPTRYIYDRFRTTVFLDVADVVSGIRTWHPAMKTREGIRVGTKREAMIAVFGRAQRVDYDTTNTRIIETSYRDIYFDDYPTRGIAFISTQRARWTQAGPVPIDLEPMIEFVTVERVR